MFFNFIVCIGWLAFGLFPNRRVCGLLRTTEKEALKRLFADDVEAMKQAEQRWAEIEERLKLKQEAKEQPVREWILKREREKKG